MPILYSPTKFAFFTEGDPITEPEHKDSCDINKMMSNAIKGLQVRGGPPPVYGEDDLTMDALTFHIKKSELEKELRKNSEQLEFTKEELELIPKNVREKFSFKSKNDLNESKNQQKPPDTPPSTLIPVPPTP